MTSTYAIKPHNTFLSHGRDRSRRLRDRDTDGRHDRLYVQVRSGDLFIAMATKLDGISEQIEGADEATYRQLQTIIDDLLCLQAHYVVLKKDSRYYNCLLGNPGPIDLS